MNNVTGTKTRIELAPAVASLLEQDTAQARLGRSFIRFALALLDPDSNRIDEVVTVDARFHELEAAGFPPGPGERMAERWDRMDFPGFLAQLKD